MYLAQLLQKYSSRDLVGYTYKIDQLKTTLQAWARGCYLGIINSGSRAKGTAISLVSDVDLLVSLSCNCNENNGGLKGIYDSLHNKLSGIYPNVRRQNVSIRVSLSSDFLSNKLEVDITPARKQLGNTNAHRLWVSKLDTWRQTNIQRHINDVSQSGRTNEIKLLKIWRELNKLDFPSIYLEYLLINILKFKSGGLDNLEKNFRYILSELAKAHNPLSVRIIDPANSTNVLSDLLMKGEKDKICVAAKNSISKTSWDQIIW